MAIDKYPTQNAKVWQIIGYKDKIPFLSSSDSKGLDFPVKIHEQQMPFIPELNTDNRPLQTTKNKDFEAYSAVKDLMKKQDYISALSAINEAITQNPNSVFRRDLSYDRLIAMDKLNLNDKQSLIDAALDWTKTFSADSDVPEVLYILANAYHKEYIQKESEYVYRRIINEYPQSRFAPLSKMNLAIFTKNASPTQSRLYFQDAYSDAKDIGSASEIAIQWALFEIEQKNQDVAKELINKVIDNNPAFFMDSIGQTREIVDQLNEAEFYPEVAKIAQYMVEHTKDDKEQENYAFNLGIYYAHANDFDAAHKANQAYLESYGEKSQKSKQVIARDDDILFNIQGDDDQKLQHYEYISSKYPNTPQDKKAKELTAEILLKQQQYDKVLDIFKQTPDDMYYQKALDTLIIQSLSQNDCAKANSYLMQTSEFHLDSKQKLQAFDCLVGAHLNSIAQKVAKDMPQTTNTPQERLEWLYRIAKNLYTLGDYKNAILAARDGFNLALNQKRYYDIAFDLFYTLNMLHSTNEAKKTFGFLQTHFDNQEQILPVYAIMLEYAIADKDLTATQIYAHKILDLQKTFKIDEYTPYTEFVLADALAQSKKQQEALRILKSLESKKLDETQRQKMLYQIGNIYNTQNNIQEAKSYFGQCLKITTQSDWRLLCEQAENLLSPQAPAVTNNGQPNQ